ncbi:hypothetical protein A3757_19815 [Oleiphilus sp. HI0117]|nr:hypothetical protein A3732_11010 [Oleiphilus sp. HI0050]KZZ33043.1 hypothetical protein A3757_19815 [Oleiphilus sp. HI0117]
MSFDIAQTALAVPTVCRVLSDWQCSDKVKANLIGFDSEEEFTVVASNPNGHEFTAEQAERMSHILNIYRSLHTLFRQSKQADEWINKPNNAKLFGGRAALDLLKGGALSDLALVSNYLKSLF